MMLRRLFHFLLSLTVACSVIILFVACGEILPGADPDPIEKTVRFEVDGSVNKANILTRDDSGELMHGEEESDGTVDPETVDIPWEYEYEIDASQSNYFYLEASNNDTDSKTSGSINTWEENYLIDGTASFTSTVVPGYIAYNVTDSIFREVISVDNATQLTLSHCPYPYSVREYVIFRSNSVTGTSTGEAPDKLIDSGADFFSDGVETGDFVKNTSDTDFAMVTAVDTTELTLDSDIFESGENYELFTIELAPSSSTQYSSGGLIDSTAEFTVTTSIGDIVYNTNTGSYTTISSIDSSTQLSLDGNIFPSSTIDYIIYKKRSLTCTVFIDDEEFATTTSSHWDTVEAALSETIPAEEAE